jgi:hypothetical protein
MRQIKIDKPNLQVFNINALVGLIGGEGCITITILV